METAGGNHETYAMYIVNKLGELQTRTVGFRDKKSAMGVAWVHLRARPGCFAMVIRFLGGTWASCSVYGLADGALAAVAEPRRQKMRMSVDVHTLPPSPAYPPIRQTMDII